MTVLFTNNAWGTLSVGIAAIDDSILLAGSAGSRFPSIKKDSGDCFYVTIINDTNELEIVKCTSRTNDTLKVVRAQGGTTAKDFVAGCRVELRATAEGLNSKVDVDVFADYQDETTQNLEDLSNSVLHLSDQELTDSEKAVVRGLINAACPDDATSFSKDVTFAAASVFNGDTTFNVSPQFNEATVHQGGITLPQEGASAYNSEPITGTMASNDYWRIKGIAIDGTINQGSLEIATADDGTEPIYVRQYSGTFATITRTATILDASGNTTFPGTLKASSFQATSDKRLKRDFEDIEDPDAVLKGMRGQKYLRSDRPSDRSKYVGVIAQEVQEVLPEAVRPAEGGFLSVD
jgi:hypothetical protein